MDSQANSQPVMCEVCGTYFETRRGLSSHARLHLRQLGVTVSDSSGAPIDLLYQIFQERGGSFPELKSGSSEREPKKASQKVSRMPPVPEDRSAVFTEGSAVTTTSQKMVQRGSSSKLKESASFLSGCEFVEFKKRDSSSSSPPELQTSTKPLWAPLETDAPITLDTGEEVHVCQLCGSWYESRKGLASHARSHLRQMGIPDSEIKGSPIDHLYQLMEDEDLKPFSVEQRRDSPSNSPPKLPVKRPPNPSSPSAPPLSKQSKASEEYSCILCGENFDNRKGLACHARFHLKQMGVADLLGKSSAIDTVQELVKSGMLKALQFSKTHSKSSSSAAPALPTGVHGPQTPLPSSSSSLSPAKSTPGPPVNKAPKAKKGFRLAVDPLHRKPKPEPVELPLQTQGCDKGSSSPVIKPPAAADLYLPLDAETSTDEPPTVLCDYCGQLFETRKALSCHARAHLRQLGLNWSIKSSPLDLLKEFMEHGEEGLKAAAASGESLGKATWTPPVSKRSPDSLQSGEAAAKSSPSPLDFSIKDKSPSSKSISLHKDTSCKLCGFDFENRKALASHARAHLRQLGIKEWKADGVGSPIKLLNEMIKRDPAKISAITRRYRSGDFYIKKGRRGSAAASMSPDSKPVPSSSPKATVHHHQHKKGKDDFGLSRHSQGHLKTFGTHSGSSAHSRSGAHPLRHLAPAQEDNQDSNSQQPPRSGSIPAMLPKPPLTPLVKLVGKMYSLKCRFCEKVFHGPLSVQEQWITHLQEHILSLGYKGKASPPAAPVAAPALVHPVSV